MNKIILSDNLAYLKTMPAESIDLIYIDPPFNTGIVQKRTQMKTTQDSTGSRQGFGGKTYKTEKVDTKSYSDKFDNYLEFLRPRIEEAYRVLKPNGSLYFHIDYRESHYVKVFILDEIFGRDNFLNEIIWAYDYGARSKTRWPAKHDNIFYYAKDKNNYTFNYFAMERIPYMAPGLVGEKKAALGKTPTDTWFHTIVPTNGKEKTGYPTQKPKGIIKRIIEVSSNPGDTVLDFFAGSGTVGDVCIGLNRNFVLVDSNVEAIKVMQSRFKEKGVEISWEGCLPVGDYTSQLPRPEGRGM